MPWSDWDFIGSAAEKLSEQLREASGRIPDDNIEAEKLYVTAFYDIYDGQDLALCHDDATPWRERCEAMARLAAALRQLPDQIPISSKESLACELELAVSDEKKNNDPDEVPVYVSSSGLRV